jgi:hypothetical protein
MLYYKNIGEPSHADILSVMVQNNRKKKEKTVETEDDI